MPLFIGSDGDEDDGLDTPFEWVVTMHVQRSAEVDGVEIWIEFDDAQAAGQDAQARVFTKGATGRKVWLKVYDRTGTRIFEKPERSGVDPDPPTVWTEEADFAASVTIANETSGPLASYIAAEHLAGVAKAVIEAAVGRRCDPVAASYPACGLSFKAQVWR